MIDGGQRVQERCCEAAAPQGWMIRRGFRALLGMLQQGYGARLNVPTHVIVVSLDAIGTVMALQLAVWLRFDGAVPGRPLAAVSAVLPALLVARLVCNVAAGIHRWSFRQAGLPDALRHNWIYVLKEGVGRAQDASVWHWPGEAALFGALAPLMPALQP